MIKATIIVRREVQKAGYRNFVWNIARNLNMTGRVEDMRDGVVRIVCEAEGHVGIIQGTCDMFGKALKT